MLRRSLRTLFAFATLLAQAAALCAQPMAPDAAGIVSQMRTLQSLRASRSLAATLHSTTVINVLENASRFDLVKPQTIAHEAVGAYYRDDILGTRVRIVATRGSAPLAGLSRGPIENFRTLGEIIEIGDQEIVLLNTSFPSPLHTDADRDYEYVLIGSAGRNGVAVHEVAFRAKNRLRPGFDGTLFIAVETSDLVAVDMRPSETTAIPFIEGLMITQTFSRDSAAVYLPDSLIVRGNGVVKFAALGLAETHVDFTLATRLTNRALNVAIPDSLSSQSDPIVIIDEASDVPASFWASRSALSSEQATAIEASRVEHVDAGRSFGYSLGGMLDYNRAGGATPTLSAGVTYGPVGLSGSGGYSFGLERPVGEGTLAVTFGEESALMVTARGGAFSQIATTTTGDKSYPRIMNTLVAATLHQDYYDFFRKDGWNAGVDLGYGKLRLVTTYEQSRQFSIGNNAKWSLLTWTKKDFQPNRPITEGDYTTIQSDVTFSRVAPFLKLTPTGDDDLRLSLTGLFGRRTDVDTSFQLGEGLLSYSIPVYSTGYNPITVTLLFAGGVGTATIPPQYQFRLRTSAASFGKPGGFVSPPKGRYGGTEYVSVGTEINLTDLPWRAIGLPTVNGRGIELIVAGAAARYRQGHHTGYQSTGNAWYSEAGIAISRIPLFLTEIVYGRVDLRQGFGPIGQFGGNFTFVLPL